MSSLTGLSRRHFEWDVRPFGEGCHHHRELKRRSPPPQFSPGKLVSTRSVVTRPAFESQSPGEKSDDGGRSKRDQLRFKTLFQPQVTDLISAFEFEDAGLTEESPDPNIVLQCKAAFIIQPTLSQMWPEQTRLGRHLRSRFRCSMCSAVRMD